MSLAAGTRFGPYEILTPLGAGGMGEVYRARDTRLARDVAIKVLPASFASDPDRRARFEREAQAVAALSHPNIVAIHDTGLHPSQEPRGHSEQSLLYVVMELLAGQTLRDRLASGALPVRKAVEIAVQIARGLGAAHGKGLVHRDLKPENVFLLEDGQIKILDFGLARQAVASDHSGATQTIAATDPGTVMGTVGYMAPEQVRAQAVDARTDVFAFGAVLYEMVSGTRAFHCETAADTMTVILTQDPPELVGSRPDLSPALDRIIRHCLEKNANERFQSSRDVAFALETLSTVSTSSSVLAEVAAPARHARITWLPWAVAAVALLVAAASWLLTGGPEEPEPRWDSFTRISEAAGEETSPSLSPDGTTVAYSMRVNGSWDIYSQRVGGRNATPIVNDPRRDERGAAFSPDGSLIAFHESDDVGGLFVAGATGESVRRITDLGFEPAWSPDGKQIAFATEEIADPASRAGDSTLHIVDAAGGALRRVVDGDGVQPAWSPSGQRIVYWSNTGGQRDIYTVAAAGGTRVAVTQDAALDWSPVWSPDGRFIYFSSDRGGAMNLWRVAVDQSSGRTSGDPEPVTAGVQAAAALPRFSKDGSRLVFRSRVASVNPVAIPFDPATVRAGTPFLLDTRNNARIPSGVSADGKQLAFYSIGDLQEDIFVGPTDGPMRRVTDDAPRDRAPVFTPDGRSLVFYSNRDGNWAIWMVGVDGGNLHKVAGEAPGAVYVHLSPKGDRVTFASNSGRAMYTAPLAAFGGAPATELPGTQTGGKYFNPTGWSPDGARLAGVLVTDSGRQAGIGTYDLEAHTTTMLSADEAYAVKWLSDSRRVVYFAKNGAELVMMDTVTRTRSVVDVRLPGPAVINEMFTISPDNRTIYYGASRAEADIWIVERTSR